MGMAVLIILALVIVWGIVTANRFARYDVVIQESKKNVNIAIGKRYDTILEMMKVAKAYAEHEEQVFVELVKLRQNATLEESNRAIHAQEKAMKSIFAVGEQYPQMFSSQQFLRLQEEIDQENEQLAAAKRIVNSNISAFNQLVVTFPSSLIASIKKCQSLPFIEEENIEQKQSISHFDYHV